MTRVEQIYLYLAIEPKKDFMEIGWFNGFYETRKVREPNLIAENRAERSERE